MQRPDAVEVAKGRWRGILTALGVSAEYLNGKHGPCPICPDGGKDRFRFTDWQGEGRWICNQCGSGSGFDLLMKIRGTDFAQTAKDVLSVAGAAPVENSAKKAYTEESRKRALNQLWIAGKPAAPNDPVDVYLKARRIELADYPADLRTVYECPVTGVPGIRFLNAMIALVRDPHGEPVTLHRTYLSGAKKADIDAPRRLMPGPIAQGSAIRLQPCTGGKLGVAEGIETALAASIMFEMPVWSTINATLMQKFEPPAGVTELTIFADNDASYAGHAAAYALAHSLAGKMDVDVTAPDRVGLDWADVLFQRAEAQAA